MDKKKILKKILSIANKMIPKKDIILFDSYPDFCDNSYALYKYIIGNRKDLYGKYQLIWAKHGHTGGGLDINTKTIEKKSLKGIMTFLRAKYIVSTHGYFTGVYSGVGQKQINLWHGCGYKNLTVQDRGWRGDYNIVTANPYQKLYSEFFSIDAKNVFITGYPRNDLLFETHDALSKLGVDKAKYGKIILWMPTYRKATQGHEGIDGDEKSFVASNLTNVQAVALNNILLANNILMIVKTHPMEYSSLKNLEGYSNIFCISSQQLQDKCVQLYELLTESDTLLSDYSSLVVDYLLLNKPIVMVLSDKQEYQESRGFVFSPIEDYFPGPVITNLKDLLAYISNPDQTDIKWEEKRTRLTDFFHKYKDGDSSKRVAELFWGKIN